MYGSQKKARVRPTIIVPENKIFQHFGRLLLLGMLENAPCSLNELLSYWSIFERNLVGLADLQARTPTDGGLVQVRKPSPETARIVRNWRPVSGNSPCFDFEKKTKLGQLAIRWNFEPTKSANPPRFLSKLTKSSLKPQGTFFNTPGEKACQCVVKACFVFWNNNCRPQTDDNGNAMLQSFLSKLSKKKSAEDSLIPSLWGKR